MANDLGFPDIGLTTLQDVSTRSYLISRVTNLPTIVDIDTGFKSCKETIETFEEFGISAVHLEDQIERKRCGHLDNKELIRMKDSRNALKTSHQALSTSKTFPKCIEHGQNAQNTPPLQRARTPSPPSLMTTVSSTLAARSVWKVPGRRPTSRAVARGPRTFGKARPSR